MMQSQSTAVGSGGGNQRAPAFVPGEQQAAAGDERHAGQRQRVGKVAEHEPADQRGEHDLHVGERRERRRRRALEREDEQEVADVPSTPIAASSATSIHVMSMREPNHGHTSVISSVPTSAG